MTKKIQLLVLVALILAVVVLTIVGTRSEKFQLVQFSGAEGYSKVSSLYYDYVGPNSDSISALPLYNNDLLSIEFSEGSGFYLYQKSDGSNLEFKIDGFKFYLNDELIHASINDDPEVLEWLRSVNLAKETSLRGLSIEDSLSDEYYEELANLSIINPNLGLAIGGNEIVLDRLLKTFNPKWLFAYDYSDPEAVLLYEADKLEFMFIDISLLDYDKIHKLNCLENLVVSEFEYPSDAENIKLPKSLKRLSIIESDIQNLDEIDVFSNLIELNIIGGENLSDMSGIKKLSGLHRISFHACDEITDFATLNELSDLTKLGVPTMIGQQEFDKLIEKQKKLEILELSGSDEITNLEVLATIPRLSCLSIHMEIDPELILGLNNLNYLAVPSDNWEDSEIEKLEKALPNTIIVPTAALCLGSAWLLLILPCILLFYFLKSRSKKQIV